MRDRLIWLALTLTWYLIGITAIILLALSVRYWRGADRRRRRGTPGLRLPPGT
jgi:hypothetical protein